MTPVSRMSRPSLPPVEIPELARNVATGRATACPGGAGCPGRAGSWRLHRSLHGIAQGKPSAGQEIRIRGFRTSKRRIEPTQFGAGTGNAGVMLAQDIDVPLPILPDGSRCILIAHAGVLPAHRREIATHGTLVFVIQRLDVIPELIALPDHPVMLGLDNRTAAFKVTALCA